MNSSANKIMLEIENDYPLSFNKTTRKKRLAVIRNKASGKWFFETVKFTGIQIYHLCPDCNKEVFPVAVDTGDGWATYAGCDDQCTLVDVSWPFGDEYLYSSQLEARGWKVD